MVVVQNWKIVRADCRALAEDHYRSQFCENPVLRVRPDSLVTVNDKIAYTFGGEVGAVTEIERRHLSRHELCGVPGKPTEKFIVDTRCNDVIEPAEQEML